MASSVVISSGVVSVSLSRRAEFSEISGMLASLGSPVVSEETIGVSSMLEGASEFLPAQDTVKKVVAVKIDAHST